MKKYIVKVREAIKEAGGVIDYITCEYSGITYHSYIKAKEENKIAQAYGYDSYIEEV